MQVFTVTQDRDPGDGVRAVSDVFWTRPTATTSPAICVTAALAWERAWAAGAGPDLNHELFAELCLDFDASITIAHGEKENTAATWKRTFVFHPVRREALLIRAEVRNRLH